MSKILLDYFFPISSIEPTPAASTAFLKQACLVVKPASMVQTGDITLCTNMAQVAALTDNVDAQQLFNAGMSRVFILPMDDLDIAAALDDNAGQFFTVLISSDFDKDDVDASKAALTKANLTFTSVGTGSSQNDISVEFLTGGTAGSEVVTVTAKKISVSMEGGVSTATQLKTAIDASAAAMLLIEPVTIAPGQGGTAQAAFAEDNLVGGDGLFLGQFEGVTGVWSDDTAWLALQAAITRRVAFYSNSTNKAKNMCFAIGKMLANALNWRNQQYITMPLSDDVDTLGAANALFDDKVSFVISDDEFSNRLGLLSAGAKAIVAPYVIKNLQVDLQSNALSYISGNQPAYSKKQATLLEDELSKVIQSYIDREWIEAGTVEIKLEQDNFIASGYINVAEPKALWRIFGEMRQTL
jgi:hypothetical protein